MSTRSTPASPTGTDSELAIDIRDLHVEFPTTLGVVRALNGVSYQVPRGKVVGVVGESGSGKSVTARAILQILQKPGRITAGQMIFRPGKAGAVESGAARRPKKAPVRVMDETLDIVEFDADSDDMRAIRGSEIAMIFQEPMTSLNPLYTIGFQIEEGIRLHETDDKKAARELALELLREVGLPSPERIHGLYPHELSGGMRQRAMIAMALSCNPSLLIADEPTTALDVTTEAQILSLMRRLQSDLSMSIIYITHSMGVVAQICDEVVVMYLGRIVERASVEEIFQNPKHPYTISLLRSTPRFGMPRDEQLEVIKGSVPDPYSSIAGCRFHPRCPAAIPGVCDVIDPVEAPIGGPGHGVQCHLYPGCTPGVDVGSTSEQEPRSTDAQAR